MNNNGRIIFFEMTALKPRYGKTWSRRTDKDYKELFSDTGLILEMQEMISFPFFNGTEKLIRRFLNRSIKVLAQIFKFLKINNTF